MTTIGNTGYGNRYGDGGGNGNGNNGNGNNGNGNNGTGWSNGNGIGNGIGNGDVIGDGYGCGNDNTVCGDGVSHGFGTEIFVRRSDDPLQALTTLS